MKHAFDQIYVIKMCKMVADTFSNIEIDRDIEFEFNREAIIAYRNAGRKGYGKSNRNNHKSGSKK